MIDLEEFRSRFIALDSAAETLGIDFIAAFKIKGEARGTMAINAESPIFHAASKLIDSNNATIGELKQIADALSARIAELKALPYQNGETTGLSDQSSVFVDSINGNDSNPGTRQQPVKTMVRAMDLGHNITKLEQE